jgi:hypothetical protein
MNRWADMPDWTPSKRPDQRRAFSEIEPLDVLYELDDEPIIFSAISNDHLVLCYKITNLGEYSKYIVSPTSETTIRDVRQGTMPIRNAVVQPWQWLIEASDENFEVRRSWTLDSLAMPESILPKEGVPLYYQHRQDHAPYLSIKFSGGNVEAGLIPFGVIKAAVDDVYVSLQNIFTSAVRRVARDWTESRLRRALEIPTRQMVHASLMIAIEKPVINFENRDARLDRDRMDESIEDARDTFLNSALAIANNINNATAIRSIATEHLDTLEIISRITPSQKSFFDAVEINGRRVDEVSQPAVIASRHRRLLLETYMEARSVIREFQGEVFLINGGSHQFTMMVNDRPITCVATTEPQRDEIDTLRKGENVFVRGYFTQRAQRDLVSIQVMRKSGGRTVT